MAETVRKMANVKKKCAAMMNVVKIVMANRVVKARIAKKNARNSVQKKNAAIKKKACQTVQNHHAAKKTVQ